MKIHNLEGFVWPRPDEIRKTAKKRDLSSDELLALKSRSFYIPNHMLEFARGKDEGNLRDIVTHLYNVLRELDTIEDANPNIMRVEEKKEAIDDFMFILDQINRKSPVDSIDELIEYDLDNLTKDLIPGAMDEDERIFVKHFGKGGVLREIRRSATGDVISAIYGCAFSMSIGMKRFLDRGKIDTMSDLDSYCSYVAGDVGKALNKIIGHSNSGVRLDDNDARKFGLALQKTNVLKNIGEDFQKRGVLYLPREILDDKLSDTDLFDLANPKSKKVRENAFKLIIADTIDCLRSSAEYISSIPERLTGFQAFTMIPYFAAIETLGVMRKNGADAVFSGREDAIKMSTPTFLNIARFTYSLMKPDNGIKTKEFMDLFQKAQENGNHDKYCFEPGKFEKWTDKL